MRIRHLLLAALLLLPSLAHAWWNDDWGFRKEIKIDASTHGLTSGAVLTDVPVLLRLHTGNFSDFFTIKDGAADLRFVASDEKTVLKHHVEKFDPVTEIALIWVRLPQLTAGKSESVWMYYGNAAAAAAEDAAGTYDPHQSLVLHFSADGAMQDRTANNNHPSGSTAQPAPASLAGAGARFAGKESVTVGPSASLALSAQKGWTFSAWVRLDDAQNDTRVLDFAEGGRRLVLGVNGLAPYARWIDGGRSVETPKTSAQLTAGGWHHLAVTVTADRLTVLVDGLESSRVAVTSADLNGTAMIGASAGGANGFRGEMDEVHIAAVARSADWLRVAARTQGTGATGLTYGDNVARDSGGGGSYFGTILRNVTIDGWVVIFLMAIMGVVSWVVMVGKGIVVERTRKDNASFLKQFQNLTAKNAAALDQQETEAERELEDSALLTALVGRHDHFQSSTLYRLYHVGIHEIKQRVGQPVGAQVRGLSLKALNGVRVSLDAALVRESQKLNAQMVLLTIAISGGPFLGLLGTVVGVMITFAAIAATGDVNVNAIAPGIAAALVATVAGLGVAIPALFGYNYLTTQIRDLNADMRVFVDEFMSRVAEHYGE